jgi:hypothetical protein
VFQKGIDLGFLPHDDNQWAEYGWVADELARVKLPEPWSEYSDDKGQAFFYDHNSGKARVPAPLRVVLCVSTPTPAYHPPPPRGPHLHLHRRVLHLLHSSSSPSSNPSSSRST